MSQISDRPPFRPWEHATSAPVIGRTSQPHAAVLPGHDLDRQPTVRAEAGAVRGLWLQACSLAGRSHTETATPSSGQDSYSYGVSDDGELAVFAVADGLGSRPRSHVGAHVAAVQACATFCRPGIVELFDGPPGRVAADVRVTAAIREIEARVVASGEPGSLGRDVATTLLVAILRLQGSRISAMFVRVGDPAALLMEHGRFTPRSLVFGPPAEGPANALTGCLPLRDPALEIEVARVGELPPDVAVVLVTDGVGNDLAGSAELRNWLEQRWSVPLDPAGMIDSLRYRRQGSVDDRTALVVLTTPTADAVQRPAPAPPRQDAPVVAPPPAGSQVRPDGRQVRPDVPVPASAPGRPLDAVRPHLRLIGLTAAIVAVAVVALAWVSGPGSSPQPAALPQWMAPGRTGPIVLADGDGGVRARAVRNPAGSGWVVTSGAGGLAAVDGCPNVVAVGDGEQPLPDHGCQDPVTPTLAVPSGGDLLVLRGDRLELLPSGRGWDLSRVRSSVPERAVDAARLGDDAAVLVGGGRAVRISADGQAAAIGGSEGGCPEARYVAAESDRDRDVVLTATCAGGGWAAVAVPAGSEAPCLLHTGRGDPPVPVRAAQNDLVLAFGTDGPSGTLAAAPLRVGCR